MLRSLYSSLRIRLLLLVLLSALPSFGLIWHMDAEEPRSLVFLAVALVFVTAWVAGELFLLRPLKALMNATRRLADGDMSVRIGIRHESGELNQLARAFDEMAEIIEQREQQLRTSEAKYRTQVEQIPAITYTATLYNKGKPIYVSPQIEKLLGYTPAEWLSAPDLWEKQIHHEDRQRVLDELASWRDANKPLTCEYRMLTRDGRILWLRDEAVLVSDDSGQLPFIHGVMFDVTERKLAEESLRAVNRTLKTMSECNEVLVRAVDETSLLSRICRIVVEEGGYRMAWVGIANYDAQKSVRPAAHAGHEAGYLDIVEISWADNVTGHGPIGTAIRMGKYCIVKDIQTDPDFALWRDEALERGYASCIALPLIDSGRIFGALAIYSEKPDAFDAEEVKVLMDLTDDLAYGIVALRMRDEHRKVERSLRESEGRYRAVVESFDGLLYICSLDYRIQYMNEYLAERTGFDATGEFCYKILHGLDDVCPWCVNEEVFKGETVRWEVRSPKDNRWYYVVNTPIFHSDSTLSWQAMLLDITERKQAEEALQESERYYRSLLSNMHEDILVIDQDHSIIDTNKDYLVTIGRKREELIGSRCGQMIPGACDLYDRKCHEFLIDEVLRTGRPRAARYEFHIGRGSKVWADVLFSPLKDEDGTTTHVIEAIRNVSHEIELEGRLRQAQKMEAIGTLAGGIAHDFNNILTVIIGYTEIMLFDLPKEAIEYDHLEQVNKAAHRAKELVNQILAFSRQHEQELKPLRIGLIMKEAIKLLRAALPSTIEIRRRIDTAPDGGDSVLADPTQIHQVLMNLCTNAGHAMREKGGVLDISLSNIQFGPNDTARPADLEPGSYVQLTVGDTGHGMDPALLERIFDPYFTTKAASEGTGLGLAMVHGIVKSHGGAIMVSSEPGVGSTFRVFLPKSETEADSRAEIIGGEIPGGTECLLLVDDEEALVQWGEKTLKRLGYEVVAKTSSTEALEAFRADPQRFRLVLTDQTMPHMTGVELAQEILKIRPEIPILLCTGFSELITAEKVKAMGIRELIMKPLILQKMAQAIRHLLDEEKKDQESRYHS